jgi:butyryl-CoA dehydrogenase
VAIIHHPDVRRMLMSMKSQVEAARALAYYTAALLDQAAHDREVEQRERYQALVDLLIPVVKAWITELSVEVASTGIQVHGGVGFIEETGAAQHLRDARITTIYEGTTGIQSNDLLGRKLLRDEGAAMRTLIAEMQACAERLGECADADCRSVAAALRGGIQALGDCTRSLIETSRNSLPIAFAGAMPYLKLTGIVTGGWQMARAAEAAWHKSGRDAPDGGFYRGKLATARFYADHVLSQASGLRVAITQGGVSTMALSEEQF